jgi:hypothetical protein
MTNPHVPAPWLEDKDFARYVSWTRGLSLLSIDRLWVLYSLGKNYAELPGSWAECGVYKGGAAILLSHLFHAKKEEERLFLFDSFSGLPEPDSVDLHKEGDFSDTSYDAVFKALVMQGGVNWQIVEGEIPSVFSSYLSDRFSFCHVDVDLFNSTYDCLNFLYPRLIQGGCIVIDDYGFPTCPGAKAATEAFLSDKPEFPICLETGQALILKLKDGGV